MASPADEAEIRETLKWLEDERERMAAEQAATEEDLNEAIRVIDRMQKAIENAYE